MRFLCTFYPSIFFEQHPLAQKSKPFQGLSPSSGYLSCGIHFHLAKVKVIIKFCTEKNTTALTLCDLNERYEFQKMATAWTRSTWKFTGTREKFKNCTNGQTFTERKRQQCLYINQIHSLNQNQNTSVRSHYPCIDQLQRLHLF